MKSYKGEIKARIVDARFALSGKIAGVSKRTGDVVKKWGIIASLDRKILQAELDKELADNKKIRAEFDKLDAQNPNPKQPDLDVSVKNVELAKARLDQVDLFSPVDGVIIDDNSIVPGINVTPASGSIKIVDTGSYYFEFEIEQKDIVYFSTEKRKCKIEILGVKEKPEGECSNVFSDGKKFIVGVALPNSPGIILGLRGVCKI